MAPFVRDAERSPRSPQRITDLVTLNELERTAEDTAFAFAVARAVRVVVVPRVCHARPGAGDAARIKARRVHGCGQWNTPPDVDTGSRTRHGFVACSRAFRFKRGIVG